MKALFDSSILIDFLAGREEAKAVVRNYERFISRIVWIEVLVGAKTESDQQLREDFLGHFQILELDAPRRARGRSLAESLPA